MSSIYDSVARVITDHWKAHQNKYPQKVVLTPEQFAALTTLRRTGRSGLGIEKAADETKFLGVPLDQDPATPGLLIAHDGTEVAIVQQPAA
jgi:hypothetical protein